jgi:hypothetical protein
LGSFRDSKNPIGVLAVPCKSATLML